MKGELGRNGKKEPCFVFGHSWEVPLAHLLAAHMGVRSHGSQDLFKVAGHLKVEPGHCGPLHTWLGSLSSGSQGTAGLRGLKDHPLVLPVK